MHAIRASALIATSPIMSRAMLQQEYCRGNVFEFQTVFRKCLRPSPVTVDGQDYSRRTRGAAGSGGLGA